MNRISRYQEPAQSYMLRIREELQQYRDLMAGAVIRGDPICCKGAGKVWKNGWVECPDCNGKGNWNSKKFEADLIMNAEAEYKSTKSAERIKKNLENVDQSIDKIQDTYGQQYFKSIGITCDLGTSIGYNKNLSFYNEGYWNKDQCFPAIVYRLRTPSGQLNGRYVCYLAEKEGVMHPGYRMVEGPESFEGNYTVLRPLKESDTMAVCFEPVSGYAWLSANPSFEGGLVSTITPQNAAFWNPPEQVKKLVVCIDYYADKMAHYLAYHLAHRCENSGIETDVKDPITLVDSSRKRETVTFLDTLKTS